MSTTKKTKPESFNPLDILATAAALKQVDKGQGDKGQGDKGDTNQGQEETMTQSSPSNSEENVTDNCTGTKTSCDKNGNNGVHVRKIRVLKISSDIEKMLDEHNYGNSRKNFGKPPSSWPETSVKDRKVIVKVVNGAGDHTTIVKPIDSVSVVGPSGDSGLALGDNRMDVEGDQVKSDTGNLLEADQDNVASEISGGSGDNSVSTEISDRTESSADSTSCSSADNARCSCVNENIDSAAPSLGGDTSCVPSVSTAVGNACLCDDRPNREHGHETERESSDSKTFVTSSDQSECDNENLTLTSVNDSGVTNCDMLENQCDDSAEDCPPENDGKTVVTDKSSTQNSHHHIHMVSKTVANSETESAQSRTMVININHNKPDVQSDIGLKSVVASPSSNSKDMCVKTDQGNSVGEPDKQSDLPCGTDTPITSVKTLQHSEIETARQAATIGKQEPQVVAPVGNNSDDVINDGKGLSVSDMGGDVKAVASSSSLDTLGSPEFGDSPEQTPEKLLEEELFKESSDNSSAFDVKKFPNSSSKIFLKTEPCLNSHQISSCFKPLVQSGRSDETSSPSAADHCYAGLSSETETKPVRKSIRLQSEDSLVSDLSQDSGYVEVSPGTPSGSKTFPNRLSDTPVDQKMETDSSDSSPENLKIKNIKNFLVTSSSGGILSQDLSDVNKTRDAIIALMQQSSSENSNLQPVAVTPVKSNKTSTSNKNVSPKVGKYRIGTFGSVSNSAIGLESPKKKPPGKEFGNCTKSLLGKINGSGRSVMPCIVTNTNSGNRPQVGMKVSQVSMETTETWKGHIEHDHDYCLPPEAESSSPHLMAKLLKDTSMKSVIKCSGREKRTESSESTGSASGKRPRRVSLSGRPDLPRNSSTELSSPSSLSSSPIDFPVVQPHMTARQRAKAEKAAEYVKMGNSDSKLKITGKFQDDYIYFLNTKVRSRRRTNSQDLPSQLPPDRIVVPTPKPGDIVVPHLTDADLEAIRLGKHASIKSAASSSGLGGLPVSAASLSLGLKPVQSTSSSMVTSSPLTETPKSSVTSTGPMSDEESKIINTILSMETGDTASTTVSSALASDVGTEVPSLSLPNTDTFNFLPEQMNLTPEQYEILYSAMDEVQGFEDLDCGPSSPTSHSEFSEDTTTPTESLGPQGKLSEVLPAQTEPLQGSSDAPSTSNEGQNITAEISSTLDNVVPATTQPESLQQVGENQPKEVVPSEPSSQQDLVKGDDKPITVRSLLQSNGTARSLLQPVSTAEVLTAGHLTNEIAGPPTTVQSLLKTGQSLLSTDIPGPSAVSGMQDLPFTALDKSSSQDLPFTSLEKSSLDLFENDLKLFPDSTVPDNVSAPSTIPTTASPAPTVAPPTTDYSAPWIVTVSMFWNDLPAIMIENLPFVRLVDIHKQILPAKDTGILKKRCQLLGINVGNCSEMQRYFLVQYGKAFNSKSTLIVGKNDAKNLIGYYVNPVPKPVKGEESLVGRSLEEPRVGSSKFSKVRGSKVKDSVVEPRVLDVSAPVLSQHDDITVRPLPLQDVTATRTALPASTSMVDSVSQSSSQPGRVSHRTRHKKINFLEMLKGDANNNTSLVDNVAPQGSAPVTEETVCESNTPNNSAPIEDILPKEKLVKKNNVKNVRISASSKLKNKMAVSIRERVKVKKGKEAVQEEQSMGESECENRVEEDEEEIGEELADKLPFFIGKRGAKNNDREQMAKKLKIMKNRKSGALKVKWKIFGKSSSAKRVMFNKGNNNNNKTDSREILAVIHKDMVPRNGHKHRMQAGNVFLDQYNRKDSTCVRCCTCKKLLSVDMFLIHLHEIGGSGKLLSVSQPQVISLRDSFPSETQKRLWENFQKRRRLHGSSGDRSKNGVVESVESAPEEVLPVPTTKKLEQKKKVVNERLANPAKVPLRHQSVPAIQAPGTLTNGNVRISARKRKQKQLYPIENYSFSRKSSQKNIQIDSDGEEPLSPNGLEVNVDEGGSPAKVVRLLPSVVDSATCVERVVPQVSQGSVLTLANGPEVISFTALQHEEGLDMS